LVEQETRRSGGLSNHSVEKLAIAWRRINAETAISSADPPKTRAGVGGARCAHEISMQSATGDGIDSLTERVIGCAIEVHRTLGPGLLESIYRDCLAIELNAQNLRVDTERRVPVIYKGHRIGAGLTVDLLVDERVIVEVKAVEQLHAVHSAQAITYLKLTGCPAAIVLNFNVTSLRTGLKRLVHPDLYVKKTS